MDYSQISNGSKYFIVSQATLESVVITTVWYILSELMMFSKTSKHL